MLLDQPVGHGWPQPRPSVVTPIAAARHDLHVEAGLLPLGHDLLPLGYEGGQLLDGLSSLEVVEVESGNVWLEEDCVLTDSHLVLGQFLFAFINISI